jgi:DNA primase
MGILDEDVQRVRESTDLVALVTEHLALKRVGQRFVGLCPFHQEKTPSFSVNPTMNVWHCFGCQRGGDAITFIRDIEHLDFVDAVERLAARSGITLRYDSKSVGQDRSRKTRLAEAVGAAIEFYAKLLIEAPDGGGARKYLRGRGFDGDAARRFQLGWSPDDWDRLSRHLQQKKFSRDDICDAGLAFVNRVNKLQDQFRARLMFPIYDSRGEPAGFGGRALGDDGPKYKNSPETPIYQKSRLLYGLNWAKNEIVSRNEVVICEGYTDVMAYALAGASHAVATCGTALADDHVQLLKNLARRVTLAYDADSAGRDAAERWYRWEQEFTIEVRVADLPPGLDPGDLWRDDQPRLLKSLEHAEPFLQFRLDRVRDGADRETVEGRARAASTSAAIIAEHPSDLVRDQYVMQLASALGIDIDRLRNAVNEARNQKVKRPDGRAREVENEEAAPAVAPDRPVDRRELDALRWAIHDPDLVEDWLNETLFTDDIARAAYQALANAADFDEARAASDGQVRTLLERLAVEEPTADDERDVIRVRLMVNMVEPVANRLKDSMMVDDDMRISELNAQLDALAHARETGWAAARDTVEQLVVWIRDTVGQQRG